MYKITAEKFKQILGDSKAGICYLKLVKNAKNRQPPNGYVEQHHIHPKALGGEEKDPANVVKLTVYEHIVSHILLAEAIECKEALFAIHMLSGRSIHRLSDLEKIKLEDIYNWTQWREKANFSRKGKHLSAEHCKKISDSRKGIVFSEEHRRNLALSHKGKTYLYNVDGGRISVPVKEKQHYLGTGIYFESRRVVIHKGGVERVVPETILGKYLEQNWLLGRSEKNLEKLRSEEHRKLLSKNRKGTHLTVEQRKRLSEVHKGKKLSLECRNKLSKARKGKKLSEEHRRKISKAKKGKAFSREHIQNMSKVNLGKIYLYSVEGKRKMFRPENKQKALQEGFLEARQVDIYRDFQSKKIPDFLVTKYLEEGWVIGKNKNKKSKTSLKS